MKGGPLARLAGQLCSNPEFQEWIGAESADEAATIVRSLCQVESRSALDHNRNAAALFHQSVRRPWLERAPVRTGVSA